MVSFGAGGVSFFADASGLLDPKHGAADCVLGSEISDHRGDNLGQRWNYDSFDATRTHHHEVSSRAFFSNEVDFCGRGTQDG
jgi:hypothetical protein